MLISFGWLAGRFGSKAFRPVRTSSRKERGSHSLAAVLGVAALFFAMGHAVRGVQKDQNVLRADKVVTKSFELLGRDGKSSVRLFTIDSGDALLTFSDRNKRERLTFGISTGRPGLTMLDAKGNAKLNIFVDQTDGGAAVQLIDEESRDAMIQLAVGPAGPRISFSESGRGRVSIGLDPDGHPTAHFRGARNERGISLSAGTDGPMISVLGKNIKQRADWRLDEFGLPEILVRDADGAIRLQIGVDQDGKPIVHRVGL